MEYKIFGCKVNKYYTDEWLNSEYLKNKSGIFIASCVVTDKAKRKWLKFVKDVSKNLKINDKIYISGCGAFKNGIAQEDFFEIYPEIEYLKGKIEILGEKPIELENNIINSKEIKKSLKDFNSGGNNGNPKLNKLPQLYTKKFLLIQGGCDSFCSFCLTVKKRGSHYYRDKKDIIEDILQFEKNGGKEVVLTGVNLSAWGLKNTNEIGNSRFAELLEYILKNTSIKRIRISSMGPEFIDNKCLGLFKNTRIYPHFHYSVQSGSSKILKLMNRHYDGKYIKDLLEKTKKLKREDGVEVSIGADIIVGFPGESEEDFKETYDLVKDGLITKIHAFPFSAHNLGESVPAGKYKEQIKDSIKKERMWEIEEIGDKIRENFIKRNIGKTFEVLIEVVKTDENKVKWKGWTQNYIEADQNTFEIISGKIEKNNLVIGRLK